jgi:hypothetical protein
MLNLTLALSSIDPFTIFLTERDAMWEAIKSRPARRVRKHRGVEVHRYFSHISNPSRSVQTRMRTYAGLALPTLTLYYLYLLGLFFCSTRLI